MIFDVLFMMYIGFGLGMTLRMFRDRDEVCYKEKVFNLWQTALFVIAMVFLWPLRFTRLVKGKGLMLKKAGQDVYREL